MTAPTALALTEGSRNGVSVATGVAADAANGNAIQNDGDVRLIVKNTGGSPYALVVNFPNTVDGSTVTPKSVTVAAGAQVAFGPYPPALYGDSLHVTAANVALTIVALHD